MYKSTKFWIFATICFAIFTILYAISNEILSFATILNAVMLVICIINLIMIKKSENKVNKNTVKNKKVK